MGDPGTTEQPEVSEQNQEETKTDKPEVSEEKQAETKTDKPEEQRQAESDNQSASETQNGSTPKDKDDTIENPSESEKPVQTKEPKEYMKTPDSEKVQQAGPLEAKQKESETQVVQTHGNEKTAEEKPEPTSEARKLNENVEAAEEEKEETNLESSKNGDTAVDPKPDVTITEEERENKGSEKKREAIQNSEEKKDDDGNQESKDQKNSLSQAEESSKDQNAMDIDTELAGTDSGQITVTGRSESVLTGPSTEKEDEADSAGDASPEDAMEVDSKPDGENRKPPQEEKEDQKVEESGEANAPKQTSAADNETSPGSQVTAQNPKRNIEMPLDEDAEQKVLSSTSAENKTASDDAKGTEKGQEAPKPQAESPQLKEEEKLDVKQPKDATDGKESTPGRPRRSSTRSTYQPRTLRPRTAGRANNTAGAPESPTTQEAAPQQSHPVSGPPIANPTVAPGPIPDKQSLVDPENTPRPVMEAKGLVMRVDEAVFVTEDQLDELKIARLTDKKVKTFEHLTFQDLRTYNRDQLRAYCFAYGMARRKKTEMEADMARYLSYWNRGREGFALHEYVPTSSRVIERVESNLTDGTGAMRSAATQASPASREGSATPTTSNGKTTPSAKPSSSRGATPSRGVGPAASSLRVSGSQGSSALSSAGPAGAPASTGNSQAPGPTQMGTQRGSAATTRAAKPTNTAAVLPRGFGTSFKQRVHARQAGAKFKAAYNGAGPAIVNIVENAAAYFEGKDSPEVILDQAKSYERYQFNVDMLNEIFDGVPDDSDETDGDVEMRGTEATADADKIDVSNDNASTGLFKKNILDTIASRVASSKRKAQVAELNELEKQFREMEERTKYTERTNMRLFQRLERAETKEQIEAVKKEFETVHSIKFEDCNPPPLVRRKLDKNLPPLVMSDEKCRILRFKVT